MQMRSKLNYLLVLSIVCLPLLFRFTIPVCALSKVNIIEDEKTGDYLYYYKLDSNPEDTLFDTYSITSAYVTRQVIFEGRIAPPAELPWSETLNGSTYSGTLYLSTFGYVENQTIATYVGTLDKQ